MLSQKLLTTSTSNLVVKQLARNFSTTPVASAPGNIRKRNPSAPSPRNWFRQNDAQFQWNTDKLEKAEYLSGDQNPFPNNQTFKPTAPLSSATKDKIYDFYKQNPNKNTPRAIAEKFNVSIRRVEAILKIRMMQQELVQDGFTLQSNYQEGMDKILGAKSFHTPEPLAIEIPNVKKPVFIALDEEVAFTREKAAEFLGKKPYVDLKERLGDKPFEYYGLKGDKAPKEAAAPKVIEQNPLTANRRFTYTITDINPNLPLNKREVLIREKNGTLREASKFERKLNMKRQWPNQKYYFKKEAQL